MMNTGAMYGIYRTIAGGEPQPVPGGRSTLLAVALSLAWGVARGSGRDHLLCHEATGALMAQIDGVTGAIHWYAGDPFPEAFAPHRVPQAPLGTTGPYAWLCIPDGEDPVDSLSLLTELGPDGGLLVRIPQKGVALDRMLRRHWDDEHTTARSLTDEGRAWVIPVSWLRPATPAEVARAEKLEARHENL